VDFGLETRCAARVATILLDVRTVLVARKNPRRRGWAERGLRVDGNFSGVDAPEKYEVDKELHALDRIRMTLRGQLGETPLSHPGRRCHVTTCHDGLVNDPKNKTGPDRVDDTTITSKDESTRCPVTFRVSQLGLFVVITLTICVTPLAISAYWLLELYLIPIGLAYWVHRIGTTVDDDGITARGMFRTRRVAWADVTALRLRTRSRVSAVLASGPELPLPAVHLRDLPLLAAVSGGRIPDLTTAPTEGTSVKPASPEE
jgi:hypothetical protein